jgi:hypothetical protein
LYRNRKERKNLLVEWQKGSGTKRNKMNWHCTPWHVYFEPERSIVLHELFTNQFGQRTRQNKCIIYKLLNSINYYSSMLFDSFDTMEEEELWKKDNWLILDILQYQYFSITDKNKDKFRCYAFLFSCHLLIFDIISNFNVAFSGILFL